MINYIHIKNFKSLKDIEMNCANLNILTGLNGMGKSSVIQSLLLLRQSSDALSKKEKNINLQGEYIDIGTYKDAIFFLFDKKENSIKFIFDIHEQKINIETVGYSESNKENNQVSIKSSVLKADTKQEAIFSPKKFQYLKAERISDEGRYNTDNKKLENKDFGKTGEYAWQYFVKNRLTPISHESLKHSKATSNLIKDQINAWLSEISPNIMVEADYDENDSTKIAVEYKFSFLNESQIEDTTIAFKPKNVGFGVSYVFSVILALLTAEKGDLLIIENPESHLHPKGQSKLAELMCLAAQNGVQIFCETHSEHIVNGVRVGIIKNKEFNIHEKVKIFYFTKIANEFSTKVFDIPINKNAELSTKELRKNGITGFFDQFDNDLSTILGL
jgi:predicted ATPase